MKRTQAKENYSHLSNDTKSLQTLRHEDWLHVLDRKWIIICFWAGKTYCIYCIVRERHQAFAWSHEFISPIILKPGCEFRGTFTAAWIQSILKKIPRVPRKPFSGKIKCCRCSPASLTENIYSKPGAVRTTLTSQGFGLFHLLCLLWPAGDSTQPQCLPMNKSCGSAPWTTSGSEKVLALSWVHFCPLFRLSGWPFFTFEIWVCLGCSAGACRQTETENIKA